MRGWTILLGAVAFLAIVAPACGGSNPGGPVPGIAEARAERNLADDGTALRTSTITVRFDQSFEFADFDEPLASKFELDVSGVTTGEDAPTRILVREATVSETNSRIVELTVDTLIPDGSTLRVRRDAFRRNEEGEISAPVTSDVAEAAVVLATNAFAPQRGELFDTGAAPTPTETDRDPAAQRAALEAHLNLRGTDATTKERALAAYDALPTEIVPHPKLRAAIAALIGTFAEPAGATLLTENNCTEQPAALIDFQVPPDFPDLLARVTYTETGARVLSFRPDLEGERFERLMPLVAHEAIHCDQESGRWEEIASTAFDTFLYLQLLAADPTIAEGPTLLTRDLNVDAVAMLNSGRRLPEGFGILPSDGIEQALPLTNAPHASFAELVAAAYPNIRSNESPPEFVAQVYVEVLAEAVGMDPGNAFDLVYLDELLGRATDPEVILALFDAFRMAPVR